MKNASRFGILSDKGTSAYVSVVVPSRTLGVLININFLENKYENGSAVLYSSYTDRA